MVDVVLKFDYIDDEIWEPEVDEKGNVKRGWVKAVSGINRPLLNIARIKRLYVFGGKLYVLYDAENIERYSKYMTPLPPLAVELDYEVYPDRNGDCKIWRFSINTTYEVERFLERLGVEVELEHVMPQDVRPVNFSLTPVDVTLYSHRIVGIAMVDDPQFVGPGGASTYEGRYVVVQDDFGGYSLYRVIKGDVDLEKALRP